MAAAAGDQIDEPARLRRMAHDVPDLACRNGAIT
jgi:hypothetical protein